MYLQECLREAAIWRNEDYWSAIFFGMVLACYKQTNLNTPALHLTDMVYKEKEKLTKYYNSVEGSVSEEEKGRIARQEQSITFALLGSFCTILHCV